MSSKMLFFMIVAVLTTVLMIFKVVSFEYMLDNAIGVGGVFIGIWNFIDNQKLVKENTDMKQTLRASFIEVNT